MKKTYIDPIVGIVTINTSDVIATSNRTLGFGSDVTTAEGAQSAGRRFDDWDAGY